MKKSLIFFVLMLFTGALLTAQTVMITGTVTSKEDGSPIPGANVTVKGTTVGTLTGTDGKYQINTPSNATTLVFSFIGLADQEVIINGKTSIDVSLATDLASLDEVIVVAYGTSKRSSFTGSAEVVKADKLVKIQTASVAKALEGASAGVQVTGGTGQPGSSANIRIRGIGSVNASSAPLYVVDGAPYDGDLSSINPNDVESITVLKDATSAALYGARGANGVIIVTTKKGSSGKSSVNFKSSVGTVRRAVPEYDRVNIPEYYELMWEGWKNALVIANGQTPANAATLASGTSSSGIVNKLGGYNVYNVANDQLVGTDGKINPNAALLYADDWNKALEQTGIRQDYNLSLSGGSEKSTYFASLGYLNETGMIKWSDYNRFTGRIGAASQVNNWFKMDATLSGATSKQNGFLAEGTYTTNPFYYGRMMGPIYPIYQRDAQGNIALDGSGNPLYDLGGGTSVYKWAGHTRPYAANSNLIVTLPLDERSTALNSFSARVGSEIAFLKGFRLRVSANDDMNNYLGTTYQNNKFGDAESVKGRSTKSYTRSNSFTIDEVLNYGKQIGSHNIALLAGHENYLYTRNYISATRTGYTIPTTELVAGSVAEGSTSYTDQYSIEGYFFQANYDFSNKYYVSGSFRTDGSSRFYQDVRWGSFWSIGGSWRISEENFLKSIKMIDNLKLKVSFGQQGNDNIGSYYGWQSLYSFNDTNNGNLNGAIHSQLENKTLQWEKNANLNAGLEFGLIGRIRGSFEYFKRQSSNLLFNVPLPQSTGLSSKWGNIGTMKNNGFEVQVAYDVLKSNDFIWTFDVNATSYVNEITKMPTGPDGKPQEIISGNKKLSEGHSIYDYWLREYAGVDPTDGSALYYMDTKDADGNLTGRETTKDQNKASYYYVGSSIPKFYGGVTNTFSWKGISLSALLTYQIGGDMYDSNWASLMHTGAFGSNWSTDIKRRWQKEGDITDVPRLQNNYTAGTAASSRYLTDASFLSVRNVTLSYNLPKSLVNKIDIQDARVFASGDNLALFTARKGMDPQQSFSGNADFTYVPSRIISFGLNLTF
ncbi:MAG TPA: TonB-dependent receptor [Bacteroidales bacterium]|nr:TonB-dependent receptor [Bacteroidales bacterium]